MTTDIQKLVEPLLPSERLDEEMRAVFDHFDSYVGSMSIPPQLCVLHLAKDQINHTICVLLHDDFNERRYEILREIGATFARKKEQAIALIMVTEAWRKRFEGTPPEKVRPAGEYEDKQEILIAQALTIDGRTGLMTRALMRGPDERITGLGEIAQEAKVGRGDGQPKLALLMEFFYGYAEAIVQGMKR